MLGSRAEAGTARPQLVSLIIFILRFYSKEEYDDLVQFVSQEKHLKNPDVKAEELKVWHAGDDFEEEGVFLSWYTDAPLPYLPWAPSRPITSTDYQYLLTEFKFELQNKTRFEAKEIQLFDVYNKYGGHPLCTLQSRSLKLKLRGLCPDFLFDRDYVYTFEEK